ncbi:MAG: hypothetical protein J5789_06000, partial [Oscillospiraceae bacterium]|nr:hypothetical protein [Oscillospiraceae bacterium]
FSRTQRSISEGGYPFSAARPSQRIRAAAAQRFGLKQLSDPMTAGHRCLCQKGTFFVISSQKME